KKIDNNKKLTESTVKNITSVLNYDLGVYNTIDKDQKNKTNSFINLDFIASLGEKHLNIDASIYNIGKNNQEFNLYQAMLENDSNGYRLALGFLNTWSLQSIASITALPNSDIYGISFGNKSESNVQKKSNSITPIYVFLSSPGEVRIYRDKKLISIQNFPMGNFEVDTSNFPFGIYDVLVETVIDGKITSKSNETINKSLGVYSSNNLDHISWQVFGGLVYNKNHEKNSNNNIFDSIEKSNLNYFLPKETYLIGISGATILDVLSGLNIQMSNYAYDKHFIMETGVNLAATKNLSLSLQTLLSNSGTHRYIATSSFLLPNGYGSIWASKENTKRRSDLPIFSSNNYSYGASIDLNKIVDRAGYFTISRQIDKRIKSKNINFEYSNNIYSGKYGNATLRLGIQKYNYDDQENINEKFIALNFSLPLSTWLSTGISSSNDNIKANIYANKTFDNNSIIDSIGGSISKNINNKSSNDDFSLLGYSSYEAKYNSGSLHINKNEGNRWSTTYTGKGSIAYSNNLLGISGVKGKSGVIITPNIKNDSIMTAKINGRNYSISGDNTFITLDPYSEYKIELMNSGESIDSFDIISGRNKNITLYPGNIASYKPNVRRLITVFGRIKSQDGELIANSHINNHIGKTQTNSKGEFSMDIDVRFPVISVIKSGNSICEADLDLSNAKGAIWLGDITCIDQEILASN
ncbi:CS1-pili formation C-terminal domain-containing protein, partial [Proteus mirabilis]